MKIKNFIIYILVLIMIVFSFKAPELILDIDIEKIEGKVYKKDNIENPIDVEAEKIYLVKAIHDIEKESYTVAISSSNNTKWRIEENKIDKDKISNELYKLKENNVLASELEEINEINLGDSNYKTSENSYVIYNGYINTNNKLYTLELEQRTGKIILLNFGKDDLNNEISKEEILINFVKYLDLYIVDDWYYENDVLKSDKADLIVSLIENGNRYILSIHSLEKFLSKNFFVEKDN